MVTVRQRSRRPLGRRVAVVTAGLLLLAGCGGQVGAAAVVGSGSVSAASIDAQRSALSTAATTAGTPLSADQTTLAGRITQDRTLVTYAIWHEQLRQAGLPVPLTEAQISAVLADSATTAQITQLLLATADTLRDRLTDTATLQQLVADAVRDATPVTGPTVEYELINVDSLADALAARTRYTADPQAWAGDLAAAGTSRAGTGSAAAAGTGAALISTGIFSAAVGDFVVVPAGDATATVVRVTAHSSTTAPLDATSLQQAGPAVTNAIGAMLLNQRLDASAAAVPPVEVNPRFGVWDPAVAQVVPAPARL